MLKLVCRLMLVLWASLVFASLATQSAFAVPPCATLATDPANGLAGAPNVKSSSSSIVPASGNNAAYCLVRILFGTNLNQNINILIGLPLSVADGGQGRLLGAWNGRTQGLGGGGCAGVASPNALLLAINNGYVASGNDTGHSGGNCEPGGALSHHLTPTEPHLHGSPPVPAAWRLPPNRRTARCPADET